MTHRPYRDETDLTLLLKWLSERAHTAYMHPGDLVWWLRKNATIDPVKALELFFDEQGDVQAMAFVDGSWSLLEGNADVPAQVWDDIVASVLMKAQDQGKLVFQPHETDTEQLATSFGPDLLLPRNGCCGCGISSNQPTWTPSNCPKVSISRT